MSQENVATVRRLYDAFAAGDVETILTLLSPDIVWTEAENFPYADNNPYRGREAVLTGVFGRLGTEWQGFGAHPEELLDAGDSIVVLLPETTLDFFLNIVALIRQDRVAASIDRQQWSV